MTEATNLARAALGPIVDQLLAENPQLVEQYNAVFADGGGAEWITYGVTQRAGEIDQLVQEVAAEAAENDEDEQGFGIADLFAADDEEVVEFTDEEFLESGFEVIGGDAVPA